MLLVNLFQALILSTVVLYCLEMAHKESPFLTVYVFTVELLGLFVLGFAVFVFGVDSALTLSFWPG